MTAEWAERAADRSPVVQRSRARSISQAQLIVAGTRRLIAVQGSDFTTQELCKSVGVALRTFYRYFAGKDQLLLAVIEAMVTEHCVAYQERIDGTTDPVERLRSLLMSTITMVAADGGQAAGPSFITTEHWRLHRLYPKELASAIKPFNDLVLIELQAAVEQGLLAPPSPEFDAWLISQLAIAIFHHYAFAPSALSGDEIAERVWAFCLNGLNGLNAKPR